MKPMGHLSITKMAQLVRFYRDWQKPVKAKSSQRNIEMYFWQMHKEVYDILFSGVDIRNMGVEDWYLRHKMVSKEISRILTIGYA